MWEGTWKSAATKTGPNDAGCVIWAKSESLFFISFFFCTNLLYIDSIYAIHGWEGTWKPAATKTGPNDAGRVVWAKSEFFCYYFFFFVANLCFTILIGSILWNTREGEQ